MAGFQRSNRVSDNMPGGNDNLGDNKQNGDDAREDKAKRTSVSNDKVLMTEFSRERTGSAHGIRIPLEKTIMSQTTAIEEKAKEKQYVMYDNLSKLFDGTEQQVLYRINMLVHQHVNLNELKKDSDGFGVLHHAVINQFVTVAEKLIENGATILEEDKKGYFPLHYAMGEAFRKNSQKDDVVVTDMEQTRNGFIERNSAINFTPNVKSDKEKKIEQCQCDEMAALIISKMKPFRVRQMFGDGKDLPSFMENEDTKFKTGTGSEVTSTSQSQTSGKPDAQDDIVSERFQFMDVIQDEGLQETARTILDKLEDTHPKKNKPVVYIHLLLKEHKVQNKDKKEKAECPFHFIARNREALINHPVYRAVVSHKWKDWAFCSYLTDTILYFLSFTALTICTVVGAQSDGVFIYDSPWQYTRLSLEILMCLFILRSLFTEIIQFIM